MDLQDENTRNKWKVLKAKFESSNSKSIEEYCKFNKNFKVFIIQEEIAKFVPKKLNDFWDSLTTAMLLDPLENASDLLNHCYLKINGQRSKMRLPSPCYQIAK